MIDIKPKSILEQPIYMLTKPTPCPYLDGRVEKRIATDITYNKDIYDELALNGFRRVENWMYRPVCDNCSACKSYRVIIDKFELTKSLKRINKKLSEISYKLVGNKATREHYDLFKKYQLKRHIGGSMADMDEDDFISMIETSPIQTFLMEFRDKINKLIGVILLDVNNNTLSAVYSFFEPNLKKNGLGNFMISQCLIYGKKNKYKYLYLGYYISQISSMSYKIRFQPGQILDNNEWENL
ncbi:arginyltransferase [Alphaproteobacteria bacterium]|nr:arginyltransferase [Alphaproteobacteria bacterium]MDC1023236.1 arginyltransferase [Alphaproteobacteria bacterium]